MKQILSVLSPKRRKEILRNLGPVNVDRPPVQDLDRLFICTECMGVSAAGAQCPRCESTALIGLWRLIPMTENPTARLKVSPAARNAHHEQFYRPATIAS